MGKEEAAAFRRAGTFVGKPDPWAAPKEGKGEGNRYITNDQLRRRLAEEEPCFKPEFPTSPERRLAAIPISQDECSPTPGDTHSYEGTMNGPADHLPLVGALSGALCFMGCLLRRYYRQFKARVRQDSFGFLPDSRRNSLTGPEKAV